MESKQDGEGSMASFQLLNIVNPNSRITRTLFDGNNYKDWAYSTKMAIRGPKRVGYINCSIKEPQAQIQNTLIGNLRTC